MISIIICSVNLEDYSRLEENIVSTIGDCKFELLRINNRSNDYGIAEAYNKGLKQASFPFLLFIHEDVLFHTQDWGEKLLSYFEDKNLGLVGIAGSRVKNTIPSGWWNQRSENILMNIIQNASNNTKQKIFFGFEKEAVAEVVVIDGVFMAARKDKNIRFNENLKGFHNYDQSISLEYKKIGYKVKVTGEILLEHFSKGNKNAAWIKSLLEFHRLYQEDLPQAVSGYTIGRKDKAFSCLRFIYNCKNNNMKGLAFKYWLTYLWLNPLDRKNFQLLRYFLKIH